MPLKLSEQAKRKMGEASREPVTYNVLDLAAIRNTDRYEKEALRRKRYLFKKSTKGGFLKPQTTVLKGATGRYHLALQWNQYPASVTSEEGRRMMEIYERWKGRPWTYRVDSLQALSAADGRMEMSDLKPMTIPEAEATSVAERLRKATPYPYTRIRPRTPLLLRFEVYQLAFGPEGNTHYTVEYDVHRRTERGGLRSLFQGDEERRTSTATSYTGTSRAVQESILLDLDNLGNPAAGELRITVRVTDENTGTTKERTLRFETFSDG